MAFACIYIPDFVAQAIVLGEPALRRQAVAVVDGSLPPCTVIAANEAARQVGVQLGMPQPDVEQFPSIQIRRRAPGREATARAALLEASLSFSPRVEQTAADTLVLDLAGLTHLLGSLEQIAQRIAHRVSELGLEARVAVASNPDTAIHMARGCPGITVIPPGSERHYLGDLPVQVLAPTAEILETLERWGVRNLQALAALPTAQFSERLGQKGVCLQQLARGNSLRSLVPVQPAIPFVETLELEHPIDELEPLAFLLGRLLNQLCSRLSAHSLATNELRLQLELETSDDPAQGSATRKTRTKMEARKLRLPVPTRNSKMLLHLWRLHLQANPPQAPIRKLTIVAEPAKPRVAQGGLFLPRSPDPEKLEVTLARIANLVGDANVGSPELLDTHRPEAFRMGRFYPLWGKAEEENSKAGEIAPNRSETAMALRAFRPPLRATVEVRAGIPVRISFLNLCGDVVTASGPWRTSGDWWTEEGWEQDEWDVEIQFRARIPLPDTSEARQTTQGSCTGLYRIYRETSTKSWFIRGAYD